MFWLVLCLSLSFQYHFHWFYLLDSQKYTEVSPKRLFFLLHLPQDAIYRELDLLFQFLAFPLLNLF